METTMPAAGAFTILTLGLLLGLKHAIEVDHVVAVSTIVSRHQTLWRSAGVGFLWGLGHTASLLVIGVLVIIFKVTIPQTVSGWFEFLVAIMIILLGGLALFGALRKAGDIHYHRHHHPGHYHSHLHFHKRESSNPDPKERRSHHVSRIGLKPFVVGSIHGLAGSAALTLLILPQIESTVLAIFYLLVFGFGSVAGMLFMSVVVGLPFALASRTFTRTHYALQVIAAGLSLIFGVWYAYLSVGVGK